MLITHGESGRSGVGRTRNVVAPTSLAGQFEQPYGPLGPPTLFTIPVLRYMKTYRLSHEQLAMAEPVETHFMWRPQLRDPADELVLEAAVNGQAAAIVTFNRRDFGGAPASFGIQVLTPAEAIRRIRT